MGSLLGLEAIGAGCSRPDCMQAMTTDRIGAFRPCLPPMHLTVETQSGPEMNQFPLPVSLNLMNRAFA